jgi:uncharacterized membrane-anchored protein YhcB (DUF1043 family)
MSLLQEFEKHGMNKSNAKATAKNLKELKKKDMAKKMSRSEHFEKQQKKITKERRDYAKKHPGTYKGRPISELRKEARLDD